MSLDLVLKVKDPDGVYQRLISAHEGRSAQESLRINARLILLLMNHIGDEEAINEAIELASDYSVSRENQP